MAETYLALSGDLPGLRSLVVVKRILPHLSSKEDFVRMFFDEARIGALLDHPNIARIIEVGHDDDGYFLVMEPVQGKPLSAVLRRGGNHKKPLEHAQSAFIVGQAANGLGYAHALTDAQGRPLNVVHRDVSPENILVSFDGAVKVIDFGIASAFGRLTETMPGGLKGKIEYMSPEQVSGGAIDRRSDVFALGVVLWEALCGRRLFRRNTDLGTMRAILDDPISPPSRVVPISRRLERIVMRALEKDPDERFQDAREMALLLQQHAFACEGFDLIQLSAHMKRLFAADHTGWKSAASTAVDIEGRRPQRITSSFSFLHRIDSHTGHPTVALSGDDSRSEKSLVATLDEGPGNGGDSSASEAVRTDRTVRRSRSWIVAGVALVGLVCGVGGFLWLHSGLPMTSTATSTATTTSGLPVASHTETPMVLVPIPPLVSSPVLAPIAAEPVIAAPPAPRTAPVGAIATRSPAALPGASSGNRHPTTAAIASTSRTTVHAPKAALSRPTVAHRRGPGRRVARPPAGKRPVGHRAPAPVSPSASAAPVAAANPTAATPPAPSAKATPPPSAPPAPAAIPASRPEATTPSAHVPWHDPFD